jgi:hypothetical protein
METPNNTSPENAAAATQGVMGSTQATEKKSKWSDEGYILEIPGEAPGKNTRKPIHYELPAREEDDNKVSHFGRPISQNLANQLIKDLYIDRFQKVASVFNDSAFLNSINLTLTDSQQESLTDEVVKRLDDDQIYHISFSKDVLTMLLSQSGCAGIKFYYCKGLKDESGERKPSLILVGVNDDDKDLGTDAGTDSIIFWDETPGHEIPTDNGQQSKAQQTAAFEVGGTKKAVTTASDKKIRLLLKALIRK